MTVRQVENAAARAGVTAPKQDRSRRSFEQVRRAVVEIVTERAGGPFSIAEVSKRAGVSVGSIYGRVSGKAELLRVVQAEEYDGVDEDLQQKLAAAGSSDASLDAQVRDVIRVFATALRDSAPVLTPFFVLSMNDEVLRERGLRSAAANQDQFVRALARVAAAHEREFAASDLTWTHEIVFSTLARHIDFGSATSSFVQETYDWPELLERICATALRYLNI